GGEQAAGGGDGAGRRRLGSARADLADESVPDAHSVLGQERVPVEDRDIEDIEIHCCLPTALSKLGRVAVAASRRGSSAASGVVLPGLRDGRVTAALKCVVNMLFAD